MGLIRKTFYPTGKEVEEKQKKYLKKKYSKLKGKYASQQSTKSLKARISKSDAKKAKKYLTEEDVRKELKRRKGLRHKFTSSDGKKKGKRKQVIKRYYSLFD